MVSKQRILRIWFRFESKCNRFLLKCVLALWCNRMLISGLSQENLWSETNNHYICISETYIHRINFMKYNSQSLTFHLFTSPFFMLSPSDVSWHNIKRYQSGKYRGEYEFIIIKMYLYFIKYKFNHLLSSSFWFRRQEE